MRIFLVAVAAGLVGAASLDVARPAAATSSPPAALAPGDLAPAFTLKGSDGRSYSLADYRGRQAVVLAWFAKAFTGG